MSDTKLDKIQEDITEIKVDISAIKVDVATHISRTHQNEARIDTLQSQADQIVGAVNFIKIIGVLAAIAEVVHMYLK